MYRNDGATLLIAVLIWLLKPRPGAKAGFGGEGGALLVGVAQKILRCGGPGGSVSTSLRCLVMPTAIIRPNQFRRCHIGKRRGLSKLYP